MLTNSTKQKKNGKRAFTHLPFYRFLLNYYLSSSIAACAAASRAIGTLNGEQLT